MRRAPTNKGDQGPYGQSLTPTLLETVTYYTPLPRSSLVTCFACRCCTRCIMKILCTKLAARMRPGSMRILKLDGLSNEPVARGSPPRP